MGSFDADYFDGKTSRKRAVQVHVTAGRIVVTDGAPIAEFRAEDARIVPRVGSAPQRIELPGGALLTSSDFAAVEQLLGLPRSQTLAYRLEQHLPFVLLSLAGLMLALFLGYRHGVPWAARVIAQQMPMRIESGIAEEVLASADRWLLQATRLPVQRRTRLAAEFARLRDLSGLPREVRLEFRHAADFVGANAFALPGGVVVLTDQLVEAMDAARAKSRPPDGADADRLIAAVLAHELGHVERRHSMRLVLQNSIVALVSMAIFGDASSVAGVAATLPTTLVHTGFSRDFEREADRFAFDLLRNSGASPADFASAMQALEASIHADRRANAESTADDHKEPGGRGESARRKGGLSDYLSTHPDTDERIAAARAAAGMAGNPPR
ncbi:MAG TPA: M48 family metallopeptidase [Usitatibacteraceae bacterium]|nr:M48 family metallopeptidase [Usitatibacteraceae bacterium]